MKILLVDNYDSFTYNLVHYLEGANATVHVVYNDQVDLDHVLQFDKVVISPGPGLPEEAGKTLQLIERYYRKIPILGVCLGFQAIYNFFGGSLYNLAEVKHGVSVVCHLNTNASLFQGIPNSIKVGLYHSWAADKMKKPKHLLNTATSEAGILMAFEHESLPIFGLQFHPESILTEFGHEIIKNFLEA